LLDKLENTESMRPNEGFRIMLSSDAAKSIPFGLLERAIKLTNEPPSGLKANLKRAICSFERDDYEDMEPRTKGILFGVCHFHAIMLERKKFGSLGYNMMYPFAVGDLLCSAVVLRNYMENAPSKVPWDDLKYLFGEIMYGGHIVNDFDRLVANTYLDFFLRDDLLDEMLLFPYNDDRKQSFSSPKTSNSYDRVLEHVDTELKNETPLAYGLHPNAEIGFRTNQANTLLDTVTQLQPRSAGASGEGDEGETTVESVLQDILDQLRDATFDCMEIADSLEEIGPFQNVFLQECDRMNTLVAEIVRSLNELELGLKGDLTMSAAMEGLSDALFMDQIPASWAKLACPSLRTLATWMVDLGNRLTQLSDWTSNPLEIPATTWLPGIFNPQSFLTAIMQTAAQNDNLELNKLTIVTEPTKKIAESIDTPARDGCYVHGFSVEGAHWDTPSGSLEISLPREMFCEMPVINCRAMAADDVETGNFFMCPVYRTRQRGPTYIFTANLRTKAPKQKWILGGVCLILDTA
jgi:dynein heavy chain